LEAGDDVYFEREERAIYTASRLGTPAALRAQSVVTSRTGRPSRMVCASSIVSESEKASRPSVGGARGETRRTHIAPHQHNG
jgi:hypothetical protein